MDTENRFPEPGPREGSGTSLGVCVVVVRGSCGVGGRPEPKGQKAWCQIPPGFHLKFKENREGSEGCV